MRKISWLDHFINLIVVIAGISVAYTLNNWNESRKVSELQGTYIQSMVDDLDFDIAELDSLTIADEQNLMIFQRVMRVISEPLSEDSSAFALSRIASMTTFDSRNITYESIKSSGKFELLDLELRINIIEFYHHGYERIEEIESYYKNNFDNQIIPLILQSSLEDHIFDSEGNKRGYSLFTSEKFRTIMALHISFLTQKIQAYKNGHQLALNLEKELKASL